MSPVIFLIFILSVLLVVAFSIINSYFFDLKGGSIDAERFLFKADEWVDNGSLELVIDANFFIQFIGIVRQYFPLDEFWLTLIGVALYYITLVLVISRIKVDELNFSPVLLLLLFVCFLSPSVLMRISALLREPYIIFFGFISVLFGLKFIVHNHYGYLFSAIFCSFVAGLFHKAFLAFFPIFIILVVSFSLKFTPRSIIISSLLGVGFSFIILFLVPYFSTLRGGDALAVLVSGDYSIAEKIVGYKSERGARATYDYGADFSSLTSILYTSLRANIYYYLYPFPWKISSLLDFLCLVENFVRAICLMMVFRYVLTCRKKEIYFVILCYLALNTIWALGTLNYGTGSRHHITTMPLILLAYLMTFTYSANKKLYI